MQDWLVPALFGLTVFGFVLAVGWRSSAKKTGQGLGRAQRFIRARRSR